MPLHKEQDIMLVLSSWKQDFDISCSISYDMIYYGIRRCRQVTDQN